MFGCLQWNLYGKIRSSSSFLLTIGLLSSDIKYVIVYEEMKNAGKYTEYNPFFAHKIIAHMQGFR